MRTLWEILQFEFRQQLKTPFLWAVLPVFFLIHLFSITSTGITLWAHPQANINSAYAIAVTETTLGFFGMLPVIVFVATAILRDGDTATTELFFVKPITRQQYLWGRFAAACLLATLVGLTGLLGSLTGTLMPWLDQYRVAPFSLQPFKFCFFAIVLPNVLILCALFFSVASLTRSLAATVGLALVLMAADLVLANYVSVGNSGQDGVGALVLLDHSATLIVDASSRNLTVAELNVLLPQALLLDNRLLWLAIAFGVLLLSFKRFRFDFTQSWITRRLQWKKARRKRIPRRSSPVLQRLQRATRSSSGTVLPQLGSQLRMDLRCVLRSPLFLLILVLGTGQMLSEFSAHVSPIMDVPLYPVTSQMLGFFRYGMMMFVLIIAIYYSGVLTHRERESGIAEIVAASPFPDWIVPVSKALALCAVITMLLLAMMLTAITLQAFNGYTQFELELYLRSVFLYNGFYYWMLCVPAVLIQIVAPNKWLGMLLLFVLYVVLLSLGPLGFEHILYGFAIPDVIYSDMNGFGHVSEQVHALIAYWACFCVLLLLLGHLLYPRGVYASFRERVRDALARLTPPVTTVMALFALGFVAAGSWIFYNTNVLNAYQTTDDLERAKASYETKYGKYENRPSPSFNDIDMTIDIFPEMRRLESRGKAILRNNKNMAIDEFVVSVNPKMKVNLLDIGGATLTTTDAVQGFYLFKLNTPLEAGMTATMTWDMSRINRGFANSNHDTEVVENGTFVSGLAVMPAPGFDYTRKLDDNAVRRRLGLKEAARLPALGDPEFLDKLAFGVDGGSEFRVVISTAADQTAVAPGVLKREWRENERRYFEYVAERPIPPHLAFTSARYEITRDRWHDVALEIYYYPKHAYNVEAMLATAKRSLDYFTREFSPYPLSHFRILEYPRYRTAAQAFPGVVPYSEAAGFVTNLATLQNIDYSTIHELAHIWWGGQAAAARMQGRELLNESLAQYSTLMVYKANADPALINRMIGSFQRGYLENRSKDTLGELPVMYTEDQGYISYFKGALALYALQEMIGENTVNQALRNYLTKFAFKRAPFATSRDLVNELRSVAGSDYQDLITDLFEKIVLYDVQLVETSAVRVSDGYEVSLTVSAQQFEANGKGEETEVPLHNWFDVALFPNAEPAVEGQTPLYQKKHLLKSGENNITVRVSQKPAYACVDPYHKMADRRPENNGKAVHAN